MRVHPVLSLAGGLALLALAPGPAAPRAAAEAPPSGDEVARRVDARDDGAQVSRTLVMELFDAGGTTRTRVTRSFRRDFDDERRSALFFVEPANLKDTALLSWDYPEAGRDDDQWLYLPALRKSRRVAGADRGQAFLGTDFSYEDMKKETRLGLDDYRWRTLGEEAVDAHRCWVLEGTPVDEATARELGYGRLLVRVDAELWLPRLAEYWTPAGAPLKTIRLREIEPVQGIWTPHRIEAENLQNGHRTVLRFSDVDHLGEVPADLFTEAALRRGAP